MKSSSGWGIRWPWCRSQAASGWRFVRDRCGTVCKLLNSRTVKDWLSQETCKYEHLREDLLHDGKCRSVSLEAH